MERTTIFVRGDTWRIFDIQHHQVGPQCGYQRYGLLPVPCFSAHNPMVIALKKGLHPAAHNFVIIGNDNAQENTHLLTRAGRPIESAHKAGAAIGLLLYSG
jgi:hypothetical protein